MPYVHTTLSLGRLSPECDCRLRKRKWGLKLYVLWTPRPVGACKLPQNLGARRSAPGSCCLSWVDWRTP
jgi:hypothetical protein